MAMIFDDIGGIKILAGFNLRSPQPLDLRQVVDTIAERDQIVSDNSSFIGMQVYVKETDTLYILTNNSWKAVGYKLNPTAYTRVIEDVETEILNGTVLRVGETNTWYFVIPPSEHNLTSPYTATLLRPDQSESKYGDNLNSLVECIIQARIDNDNTVKVYFDCEDNSLSEIKGKIIIKGV